MRMPDVNFLIYAHRADDPAHAFYRRWVEQVVAGPEPFALSLEVAAAIVRMVTHERFPGGPRPCRRPWASLRPSNRPLAVGF